MTLRIGRIGAGLVFGLAVLVSKASGQPDEPAPELASRHGVEAGAALHLVRELGPEAWPNFALEEPTLLLLTGDAEYLLGRATAPPGFITLAGEEFGERPVHTRPPVLSPGLQACFPVLGDGVDVVVAGTPARTGLSPAAWTLMIAHELFHVFQGRNGINERVLALAIGPAADSSWHLGYPFPYDDPDVVRAMHLLGYELFRVASADPKRSGSELTYEISVAREAFHNLARVLQLAHGEPKSFSYLRYQTTKEGVARYFEHELARLAGKKSYRPPPGFVELAGEDAYARAWTGRYRGQLNLIKHAGKVSGNRIEFYALGHGMALALDRIDPGWKRRYLEPGGWVDALFAPEIGGY